MTDRALAWLRWHRHLDERPAEDRSNQRAADTPIDALARLALASGTFVSRPFVAEQRAGKDLDRKAPRFSASCNGFDVHCAVRVEAPGRRATGATHRERAAFGARRRIRSSAKGGRA